MFNQTDLSIQIYKKVQVYILSLKKIFCSRLRWKKGSAFTDSSWFQNEYHWAWFTQNQISEYDQKDSSSIRHRHSRIESPFKPGKSLGRIEELLQIFWKHRTATGRSRWSHKAGRFVTLAGGETVMIALIIITFINNYPNHDQSTSKLLPAKWWRKIGQITVGSDLTIWQFLPILGGLRFHKASYFTTKDILIFFINTNNDGACKKEVSFGMNLKT